MSETTKFIGIVFAGIILITCVSIIGVGLGIITLPWHSVSEQVDTSHDVIDKTYTADNALNEYHWFKQTYEDINAAEMNIQNTKDQMDSFVELNGNNTKEWDYQTKETYRQLQTTYTGQKSYYNGLVADYNAKSNMSDKSIFKNGLPMNVDNVLESTNF